MAIRTIYVDILIPLCVGVFMSAFMCGHLFDLVCRALICVVHISVSILYSCFCVNIHYALLSLVFLTPCVCLGIATWKQKSC